jgi:hypothetical protein
MPSDAEEARHPVEVAVEDVDKAFNRGDLNEVLDSRNATQ